MVERDIVIVGAGPVGLAAALAVRATGRPATVVEAGEADRVRRAIRGIAGRLAPSVPAIGRWMDKAPYGPPLSGADRHGMCY